MTVILLRHGRSTANTAGVLAGRSEGVELDEKGREQADRVVERLTELPIVEIVTSPVLRCRQTVTPLATARELEPTVEPDLAEVDYGTWTGRKLGELGKEPLWKVVQQHPSAAVFPEGEGLAAVQARVVAAVRRHDARLAAEHGRDVLWVACSHGDPIKAVLADALGCHLDTFQRITADPCSVSVVRYTETLPFVLRTNDTGGDLRSIVPAPPPAEGDADGQTGASGDPAPAGAVVGGGAGA